MREFDRHEQLMEIDYVHKEERTELESRLNTTQDQLDIHNTMNDLASILHKHKVMASKGLERDLVRWKANNFK